MQKDDGKRCECRIVWYLFITNIQSIWVIWVRIKNYRIFIKVPLMRLQLDIWCKGARIDFFCNICGGSNWNHNINYSTTEAQPSHIITDLWVAQNRNIVGRKSDVWHFYQIHNNSLPDNKYLCKKTFRLTYIIILRSNVQKEFLGSFHFANLWKITLEIGVLPLWQCSSHPRIGFYPILCISF